MCSPSPRTLFSLCYRRCYVLGRQLCSPLHQQHWAMSLDIAQVNCWSSTDPVNPHSAPVLSKTARVNPLWLLNLEAFTGICFSVHSCPLKQSIPWLNYLRRPSMPFSSAHSLKIWNDEWARKISKSKIWSSMEIDA